MMPGEAKINQRLREERLRRHWSQQELADKLGTTVVSIKRWERNITNPSPYFRLKLISLFDKSATELGLLDDEPAMHAPESSSGDEEQVQLLQIVQEPSLQSENDQNSIPASTSTALEPLLNRDGEGSQSIVLQGSSQSLSFQPLITRRRMLLGILTGVGLGTLGVSLWWTKFAMQHAAASIPAIITRYIFRVDPLVLINDVAWSPHGDLIACATGDKAIHVIDARGGTITLVYQGHKGFINSAQWAPDESRVASGSSDKTIHVWDPKSGALHVIYRGHKRSVLYLSWSHDGTRVASGSSDSTVQVWESATGKHLVTYTGHRGKVWSLRWAPDDRWIVSGGEDGALHVWDTSTGIGSTTFKYPGPQNVTINEVDWSPDGQLIASAHGDNRVYLWNARTGALHFTYTGHMAAVRTARWSPSGKLIASGGVDETVQVWDAQTGQRFLMYHKQSDDILEVSWAPDGKQLASASKDETLHVCELRM
jgi:transcriptional regulator with XRE-family HTH domain/dipeptidyl aminopeptidase/acylaminoacyl peptidase